MAHVGSFSRFVLVIVFVFVCVFVIVITFRESFDGYVFVDSQGEGTFSMIL